MDLKIQAKTIEQIYHLISKKNFTPAVAFIPQKTSVREKENSTKLPRRTPESCGVDSSMLNDFLRELQRNASINVHQVMVVRKGAVIAEAAMKPFRMDTWHVSHSMCKTVTSLAIGILVYQGKLSVSDKVVKILEKHCSPITKLKLGKMTVENLLTMSSGIILNEGVIVAEDDWLRAYLESGLKFEPGSRFNYNSINSYILSCIVQEISGVTMFDFLKENLFEPMGIKNVMWESCPKGRTKGGWGLYIMPEDMAKLGILMLNKGKWNGKTLVPRKYMETMVEKHMDTDKDSFGYGYHIWMGKEKGSYFFNGMLGQNIHCMPATDTIVVVTGGNNKLFGNCRTNEIIYKYFVEGYMPKAVALPEGSALKELARTERTLKSRLYAVDKDRESLMMKFINTVTGSTMPAQAKYLVGKTIDLENCDVRFLPVFMQMMNNSYPGVIKKISFEMRDGNFTVIFAAEKEEYAIPVGFDNWIYNTVDIDGEKYMLAAKGAFSYNEDGIPVFKIKLPFIEHSNGRSLKIYFLDSGNVKVKFFEHPDKSILNEGVKNVMSGMNDMFANQINNLADTVITLAETVFEPTVMGKIS